MADRAEPCVILGAGLAGCTAALLLARTGLKPLLLERSLQPAPRICGEFLSGEAVHTLAALGLDVLALGGQATEHLRLVCGTQVVEAALPFRAVGLSRRALDGALQAAAAAAGARLRRGQRVAVAQLPDAAHPHFGLRLAASAGAGPDTVSTPTLLLACGKTDLAPLRRPLHREPESLVGWQMHLRLAPAQREALRGWVEVALFDGGYAGLQAVDGERVNLCLLAPRSPDHPGLQPLLQALRQACPLLDERLDGAQWLDEAPQTIFRVPYGHLHQPGPADPPGLWRLGDQAAVIPSFTGDGMAIALHSGALAAALLQQGATPAQYHRQLLADVGTQVRRAQRLYTAGRHAPGRRALLALARRWPGLLGVLASLTRVPAAALRF